MANQIVAEVDTLLAALTAGRVQGTDLPVDLVPRLLTLGIKVFAAWRDAGEPPRPLISADAVTPTEVSVTVANVLRAAEIDLFELVVWQGIA